MKYVAIAVVGVLLALSASADDVRDDLPDHDFPFTDYPNGIVMMLDQRFPFSNPDDIERLIQEHLPLVHDCPQVHVMATIYAQDWIESDFTTACEVLKETADRFHSVMHTDPASPADIWVRSSIDDKRMALYLGPSHPRR